LLVTESGAAHSLEIHMSLYTDIVDKLRTATDAQLQAVANAIGLVPTEAAHDTPDENLAVLVYGIHPGRPESTQRVIIDEIVRSQPDSDAKRVALANIAQANGRCMFSGEKSCAAFTKVSPWGMIDTDSPRIPNTMAAASHSNITGGDVFRTVAQFRDGINALADFNSQGEGGFGPHN
jgi:hypothetical protein